MGLANTWYLGEASALDRQLVDVKAPASGFNMTGSTATPKRLDLVFYCILQLQYPRLPLIEDFSRQAREPTR